ncbi:MAG: hypothetical protein H7X80_04780, partial [bacterium]|nr:hypothetical protein [Candidatus Kapabacteria bacterium]
NLVAGDTVLPTTQNSPSRLQRVLFTPRDEREYSCVVRLETTDGAVVEGELRGLGIESHIVVAPDPLDAGDIRFTGVLESVRCTASVRANPTRPLLVRSLAITGTHAADFTFDESSGFIAPRASDPNTWWQMSPGEQRDVPLVYAPLDTGLSIAALEAEGDHSRCDDSTITLLGRAMPPVGVGSVEPIVTTGCGDTIISASIVNRSAATVTIMRVEVLSAGAFSLASPLAMPLTLRAGDSLAIPVRYIPAGGGNEGASLEIDVFDDAAVRLLQLITVRFNGIASSDSLRTHIDVSERIAIGSTATIPIILDTLASPVVTGELTFRARWNGNVLRLLGVSLQNSITKDWSIRIDSRTDSTVTATLTPPDGAQLYYGGVLCELTFLPFLGPDTLSPIDVEIAAPSRRCIVFPTATAIVHFDSICGLATRLIEMFPEATLKVAAAPNPFTASASIVFTLPVPAFVRVDVIDAYGRTVAELVHEQLDAGAHVREWNPGPASNGQYFVRLTSGDDVRVIGVQRAR